MKRILLLTTLLSITILLKAQTPPYPILSIDSAQFVNQAKLDSASANTIPDYISPFKNATYRDTVRFDGIVVTNPKIYGLSTSRKAAYIQRKGGGPWSGALVMCEPSGTGATLTNLINETKFYNNFIVGYPVRVTGVFRDFQGETQFNLIRNSSFADNSVEQLSLDPDTLVYTTITADQLMLGNPNTTWVRQKSTGEKWEGVLVNIPNVTVYSIQQSGNRTFWSVIDDMGNVLDVRDMSAYFRRDDNEDTVPKIANTFQPPIIGTRLEYIRGIVTEYAVSGVQRYGIIPIYPGDVGPCNICPPKILRNVRTPKIVTATDSVTITSFITSDTTLSQVTLHYADFTSNTFTTVPMEPGILPGAWRAKIPPMAAMSVVKYFVRAIDNRNLRTTFPDSLATNSNYLVTDGGVNNIRALQFSPIPGGATVWAGDTLTGIDVRGIVTGVNFNAGATRLLTLQDGTGPNSAIFIQRPAVDDITQNWKVGDSVQITSALVLESFNITTLNQITGSVLASNRALPAFETTLSLDSFVANRFGYGRKWEGVLVKWDSVYVRNVNPDAPSDFEEWSFHTDSTKTGLRVDDMSFSLNRLNDTLTYNQMLSYVQGPMYYAFGNFKVIPRSLSDVGMCQLDTAAPTLSLMGNTSDTVEQNTTYMDPGVNALDGRDGNIANRVQVTGVVNTAVLRNYVLTYTLTDYCGNAADTVVRTVVVIPSSNGLSKLESAFGTVQVYPNPASGSVVFRATLNSRMPVTVTLSDLLGKTHVVRQYETASISETVDVSHLPQGMYIVTYRSAQGNVSLKLMITK